MTKASFYGWKLLAAFWFIYLVNLGFPTYGQSVINAYMAKDLHLDRAMLGLAFSIYMAMVGLPGPAVAAIVNKIGVRFTLLIGSCSAIAEQLPIRDAGRALDGAVRSYRMASSDLFRNSNWVWFLRGRRDRRAARNRAMVCP
jgi:MFS family permease